MPEIPVPALLVLDFDGVICDSLTEVAAVALAAFRELVPSTSLPQRLGDPRRDTLHGKLFAAFRELVPLGNRAEDFGVALCALERGLKLPDQQSYDRFMAGLDADFLAAFHHEFYRQRQSLRERDPGAWLALHAPYGELITALTQRPRPVELAIATSKDAASVRALLDHFQIGDLVPAARILDKETGRSKAVHLRLLAAATGIPPSRTTFVDDKVNHLLAVAHLGVRPVLAGWGYNTARERRLAAEQGFAVAELAAAAALLFPA